MISFPFDNESEEVQDRNISSDIFAEYLQRIIGTNGIFAELGNKMQVLAGSGMNVTVMPGDGFVEGRLFAEIKQTSLKMYSSESLDRIDRVVIRLNKQTRDITLSIIKGTAQTKAIPPLIIREGDIFDLAIADLFVGKNSNTISQQNITDLRLNSQLCGIVPIFGSVDTSKLYTQIQKAITDFDLYVKNKTIAWNTQMQNQKEIFETQKNEIQAWYDDIRTAVFAKMQLNFDNFIYMPGKTYKTRFNADNSITERIANTLTDITFCERRTTFKTGTSEEIIQNIKCDEFNVNMTKTTIFRIDGSIDEAITGTVGLLEPSTSGGTMYHNLLTNLSFEKSNHTGFASSEDIKNIKEELVGVKENLQSALVNLNGGD